MGTSTVVVAALGVLMPSNNRVGSVVILENDGRQQFTTHVLADQIARVADARAGDLDGDGDLDLAVAGFGTTMAKRAGSRTRAGWTFEQHVLLRLSGPINAIVTDLNRDGRPDIVALVSQEWEEIWAFVNDGARPLHARMIWGSTNADFGSSWISVADMDRDGDPDILYSNGDAFDYAPANSRPWQGVQWLENAGNMRFTFHRLADLPGASSPQAGDLDGDGDLDVVVVSANNDWNDPKAPSLVWLENDGRHAVRAACDGQFADASDYSGGRRPRRRRQAGPRRRRHAHQPSLRSDGPGDGVVESTWDSATAVNAEAAGSDDPLRQRRSPPRGFFVWH